MAGPDYLKNLVYCMRILNDLYTICAEKAQCFISNDYTAQSYSNVQSYAGNMNHQYTMWKHIVQPERPQMITYVSWDACALHAT